ncbi:MAG: transcription antitermination factor NusB [Oscillospiraceae bacterium]
MTRTKARELAIRLIYAQGASGEQPEDLLGGFFEDEHFASLAGEDELFGKKPDEESLGYIRTLVSLCAANREEIDSYIEKYAIGWRPERITRTAAAVLRCALAELLYVEDVPPSAVINEAVELAKNYEEPETVAFINGVLGGFMRGERAAAPEES